MCFFGGWLRAVTANREENTQIKLSLFTFLNFDSCQPPNQQESPSNEPGRQKFSHRQNQPPAVSTVWALEGGHPINGYGSKPLKLNGNNLSATLEKVRYQGFDLHFKSYQHAFG